jgi:hypothetical protein
MWKETVAAHFKAVLKKTLETTKFFRQVTLFSTEIRTENLPDVCRMFYCCASLINFMCADNELLA